ncbi:MAG: hypothetical protein C4300_09165 [Thermus sp.]
MACRKGLTLVGRGLELTTRSPSSGFGALFRLPSPPGEPTGEPGGPPGGGGPGPVSRRLGGGGGGGGGVPSGGEGRAGGLCPTRPDPRLGQERGRGAFPSPLRGVLGLGPPRPGGPRPAF